MKKLLEHIKDFVAKLKISKSAVLAFAIGLLVIILVVIAILVMGFSTLPSNSPSSVPASSSQNSADSTANMPQFVSSSSMADIEGIPTSVPSAPSSEAQSVAPSEISTQVEDPTTTLLVFLAQWDRQQMDPVAGDVSAHRQEILAAKGVYDGMTADEKDAFAKEHKAEAELLNKYFNLLT